MDLLLRRQAMPALVATAWACFLGTVAAAEPAARPNVVFILADDVGYGDLGCYGAKRIKTPNLDKLAAEGLRFTDGHCPSATCTPTRYAFLTGQYAWRKKGTNILPGDAPLIFDVNKPTLPSFLKSAGYATAAVGKWHLGLGTEAARVDWNGEIKPGPKEIGFDEHFILPATGDRVPCVYVENGRVVGLDPKDPIQVSFKGKVDDEPSGKDRPDLLRMKSSHGHADTIHDGVGRIGFMKGGKAARWVDEEMSDTITGKAVEFIEKQAKNEKPFFLYFATHDAHVPRLPHKRFVGSSECGRRGDAIQEFDDSVGQVLKALDRLKLAENTIVIVSSDNGPVVDDGYADGSVEKLGDHQPSGALRGGKYSLFEGGTRVPFLLRWPARVKPAVSDALVCQIDLAASLASLLGKPLPEDSFPDSLDTLSALLGESKEGRPHLVEHTGGDAVSLRLGTWKLIPGRPAAGKNAPANRQGQGGKPQLFDLSTDLGETRDVSSEHPQVVAEMTTLLQKLREQGRTRGAP